MALELDQRLAADADGTGLRIEPLAMAGGTAHDAHVLFQLQPAWPSGGLLEAGQELRHDAFPGAAVLPDAAAALLPVIGDVPVAASRAAAIAVLGRQIAAMEFSDRCPASPPRLRRCACASGPCRAAGRQRHGAVIKAQRRIGNEQFGIEGVARAEAVAIQTHAVRTVEAEHLRARRLVAFVAMRARIMGGKQQIVLSEARERCVFDSSGRLTLAGSLLSCSRAMIMLPSASSSACSIGLRQAAAQARLRIRC